MENKVDLSKPFYRAHRDCEGIDEVEIKVVPRYKTSDLSGDEWRVSTVATFKRKGVIVYERPFRSILDAAKFLSWVLEVEIVEKADSEEIRKGIYRHDPEECAQPGCNEASLNTYRLKEVYSRQGEGPLPNELVYYRAFCGKHSQRGDCGLEDSDKNYELVDGPGIKAVDPDDD